MSGFWGKSNEEKAAETQARSATACAAVPVPVPVPNPNPSPNPNPILNQQPWGEVLPPGWKRRTNYGVFKGYQANLHPHPHPNPLTLTP